MAERARFSVRSLLLLVLACAPVAWLARAVRDGRHAAMAAQCHGHLAQIGLALQNYHSAHGSFPPAYFADASGKPMHSWRVLLLPFMEYQALYESYNFGEPWDGPNNRLLFDRMPATFSCPNRRGDILRATSGEKRWTSYVALTGPDTVFPGPRSVSVGDISDDPGRTILLVEVADADICWLEPRDLDAARVAAGINAPTAPSISSGDGPGTRLLFADGSRHWIPNGTPPVILKALSTRAGQEKVELPSPQRNRR
jgi:hypothetical protein